MTKVPIQFQAVDRKASNYQSRDVQTGAADERFEVRQAVSGHWKRGVLLTVVGAKREQFLDEAFPPQLLEPSYQNHLRLIGRQLDQLSRYSINLVEIDGGFVARTLSGEDFAEGLLEFPDWNFTNMFKVATADRGTGDTARPATPLLPTGREDFLRAIGYELDQRVAEGVSITEFSNFIVVSGFEPALDSRVRGFRSFSDLLTPPDIQALLNEAFARRGAYQPVKHYIPASLREKPKLD